MAPQVPRGFYQAAFQRTRTPMLAVELQTGRIVKCNDAFTELARAESTEEIENEPLGKWLSGRAGAPLKLNMQREGLIKTTDGTSVEVQIGLASFNRQGLSVQLLSFYIESYGPNTGKYKRALEREREKTLAAAKLGLRAYQLTSKLCGASDMITVLSEVEDRKALFEAAAAYLTSSDGTNYAGAAFLILDGDQLLLAHSTFPQPGRKFDRSQDHRYAKMARGDSERIAETGECLAPMRSGRDIMGYLVVRFHEEERTLFDESPELRESQLALVDLLATEIALVHHGLTAPKSEPEEARDGATGLPLKKIFERTLESELRRAQRYERPMTILLVKIDAPTSSRSQQPVPTFTEEQLEEMSSMLVEAFRAIDLICHLEQHVFGILLPETSLAQAKSKAESLRSMVKRHYQSAAGHASTTISIGLAARSWETTDWHELLENGARALQEALRLGGDVVCFCGEAVGRVSKKLATPLA